METIQMLDVLKEMDSGRKFSLEFVSYDKARKTGGFIRFFDEAKLTITPKEKKSLAKSKIKFQKNQNHFKNATRNILTFNNGNQDYGNKKVHIFLITRFNGKEVIL
jgi:hypothetical protein